MELTDLPALNASINAVCTVFLLLGYTFIKLDKKKAHKFCMITALILSVAFLTSYLIYHYNVRSVKFTHEGTIRYIYLAILLSHIVLSMIIVPLVILTVIPAFRQRFDKHRKWAKITLPLWLYVSVTGVLIYLMLYQWFPPQAGF